MNRPFRTLWAASTLAALGDGIRYVAFPLLAAGLTSDPRAVSLVFAAGYLPWPLFGLVGGALSDRLDRRAVLWTINLVRAAVAGALAVLVLTASATIAALMVVSFLIGLAETLVDSSASAIVPEMVAPADLERANSWLISAQTAASTLVGAVAGAALFGWSPAGPFGAVTLCFVLAAGLAVQLPAVRRPVDRAPRTSLPGEVMTGLRWLLRHRQLHTVCGLVTVLNGVLAAAESMLVLYAGSVLRLGSLGYGLLLAVLAVSSVLGGLLAPLVRRVASVRAVLAGGAIGFGAAITAAGLTSSMPAAIAELAVAGLCSGGWNVVAVALRQRVVPGPMLGRVTSVYRTVGLTAMPVGAGLAGLVAAAAGLRSPFLIGGLLLVVAGVASIPMLNPPAGVYVRTP